MRINRMKEIGREMEKLMRTRGPDSSFSPEEAHQFLDMHLSELFEICGEAIQSRLEKTEARAAKAVSIKRLAAELEEIQNNKAPLL